MEIDGEEVVSPSIFGEDDWRLVREEIHPMDAVRIPGAARRLLDALDRMHQRGYLSLNVCTARDELRALVEYHEKGGRTG